MALVSEHVEREPDILFHSQRIKQCASLEKHADLLPYLFLPIEIKLVEKYIIIPDLSAVNFMKPDDRFEKDGLARTAPADNKIGFSSFKCNRDIAQNRLVVKRFIQILLP